MIALLRGTIYFKSVEYVILDVAGVGYRVFTPLSSFYHLPPVGTSAELNIYTVVRDDAILLYGFLTLEEKEVFLRLISITGIGPKLAANILSGIAVPELKRAISSGNLDRIKAIPGVGKKTSERIILELKDKIDIPALPAEIIAAGSDRSAVVDDVASALENLGYKPPIAKIAVQRALKDLGAAEFTLEELLKKALLSLSKN
ncbi:MAG: Holliday junction branch migration protein RuvA [Deltaproteobacteria bacterium]|nr:Holliday junction branch migration protein RuvA [Deltaproteobacteria bacterium]